MADVVVPNHVIDRLEATTGGLCTAITRSGARCKNPIFYSQHWFYAETTDGHHIGLMTTEDYEQWKTGSCPTHYALWQARNAA